MTDDFVKRLLQPVDDPFFGPLIEPIKKEAADRIEELEFVLLFISNINYGNGPDVTMEHQGWAKRALEGSKPK